MLKASKAVKDGGGNKMYGSCQALQCHSHMTDREISIRDRVLPVGSAALPPSLSPGQKEDTGQVSSQHQLLRSQPARRNAHTALPASPSSLQHIPQAYNPIPNTTSLHLPSTLKTPGKGREHGFLKSATRVQLCACL